jgi:sugar phosphate isomerase/epimerase
LGFTGTTWSPARPIRDLTPESAARLRGVFEAEGVDLVSVDVHSASLINIDAAGSRQDLDELAHSIDIAAAMGADTVVHGPGSFNPAHPYHPHRDNHSDEARDQLVTAMRKLAPRAEAAGVTLALEGHTRVLLRDAQTARDVLDEIDSEAIKIKFDPVNWITFDTVYDSGPATQAMFDALGASRLVRAADDKGIRVGEALHLHLDEAVTGDAGDLYDHRALVELWFAQPGQRYLLLEHLPVDAMPRARSFLIEVAAQASLSFDLS